VTHREAYAARTARAQVALHTRGVTRNTLRTRFLPGSFGGPASAQGTRGNRTTANTTQFNQAGAYSPPTDTAQLQLAVAGGISTVRWAFGTKFPRGVNVTATPQGSGSGVLYIKSISPTGVTMQSTDNADVRVVHLMATGPV
jgi:hypothetical protein